jgi:hypothetical protein
MDTLLGKLFESSLDEKVEDAILEKGARVMLLALVRSLHSQLPGDRNPEFIKLKQTLIGRGALALDSGNIGLINGFTSEWIRLYRLSKNPVPFSRAFSVAF